MKTIPLTRGLEAIVDDEWHPWLSQFKWHAHWNKNANTFYAVRSYHELGKRKKEYMHRRVAGAGPDFDVDHLNHNGLINLERNLRLCKQRQNSENRRDQSEYGAGVTRRGGAKARQFRCQAMVDGKTISLGVYATAEEAREVRRRFLQERGLS